MLLFFLEDRSPYSVIAKLREEAQFDTFITNYNDLPPGP